VVDDLQPNNQPLHLRNDLGGTWSECFQSRLVTPPNCRSRLLPSVCISENSYAFATIRIANLFRKRLKRFLS
jgi:hypothetical protein